MTPRPKIETQNQICHVSGHRIRTLTSRQIVLQQKRDADSNSPRLETWKLLIIHFKCRKPTKLEFLDPIPKSNLDENFELRQNADLKMVPNESQDIEHLPPNPVRTVGEPQPDQKSGKLSKSIDFLGQLSSLTRKTQTLIHANLFYLELAWTYRFKK